MTEFTYDIKEYSHGDHKLTKESKNESKVPHSHDHKKEIKKPYYQNLDKDEKRFSNDADSKYDHKNPQPDDKKNHQYYEQKAEASTDDKKLPTAKQSKKSQSLS